MCVIMLPECMYVHHVGALCSYRPKEGAGSVGTGVTGSCKPSG